MTDQYVVLNLAALLQQGGEAVVGPMSLMEAVMWNEGKTGTTILPLRDPLTLGANPDQDIIDIIKQVGFDHEGRVRKIHAIKELRIKRGLGLKEAKDAIDQYVEKERPIPGRFPF